MNGPLRAEDELTAILEGIGEGFYAVDRDWRLTRFNGEAARHFGKPASEMIGRRLWDVFPDAVDTDLGRLFFDTMARRATVHGEATSVVVGPRTLAYRLFPLGDGMGIVFRDVTDFRNAEAHRELLTRELNHRVKNMLAIVQGIATQTFRGLDPTLRSDFEQRLMTLSSANELLTEKTWNSAEIHDVVRASLRPHLADEGARIAFAGPDLRLKPRSVVALSMALHELCTNALKYGALSSDAGRVKIGWAVDGERFRMRWEESGGPQVMPPTHTGFGSRMIERGLAAELQGDVRIDYRTEGVVCTIDCPLEAIRE